MEILKEKTKSICPQCFQELDARVIQDNNSVFLEKECPQHGRFKILIEKDAEFYKRLMHKEFRKEKIPFKQLALPVTYQCNLHCPMCYEPDRESKEVSIEKFTTTIKEFSGNLVKITGGEPTLRKDLPILIKMAKEQGKEPTLCSNCVKLANMKYVKMLKKAGIKQVAVAFSGFRDDIYEKINGQRLLKEKLKAIKNLKKAGIDVILSVTLVRGVNENELGKIYRYYLNNKSFIQQLRIRSMSYIGRYIDAEPFCLSEIIELLSKASGFDKNELIEPFFQYGDYNPHSFHRFPYYSSTCRFRIDLFTSFIHRIYKKGNQNKRFRRIRFILESLSLFGIKRTVEMVINKLKGKKRLLDAKIEIRVWPDKERIDLGEIQWCYTALLSKEGKLLPFCYAIIMDEKRYSL